MCGMVCFDQKVSRTSLAVYTVLEIVGSALVAVFLYFVLRVFFDDNVSMAISLFTVIILIPLGLRLLTYDLRGLRYGLDRAGVYIVYPKGDPIMIVKMDKIVKVILTDGSFRLSTMFSNENAPPNVIIVENRNKRTCLAVYDRDGFASCLRELAPDIRIEEE